MTSESKTLNPRFGKRGFSFFIIFLGALLCLLGVVFAWFYVLPNLPSYQFRTAVFLTNHIEKPSVPNGTAVLLEGTPMLVQPALDPVGLGGERFLAIRRKVESFLWMEHENADGTVTYAQEWTTERPNWRDFKVWKGHMQSLPEMLPEEIRTREGYIGRLRIDFENAELYGWRETLPRDGWLKQAELKIRDGWIYRNRADIDNPKRETVRLSYETIPPDVPLAIFGGMEDGRIVPLSLPNGNRVLKITVGTRNDLERLMRTGLLVTAIADWRVFLMVISGLILLTLGFCRIRKIPRG